MSRSTRLIRIGIPLLLLGVASAQLHVPGDHATLQEAIDASASGGVIVVHGGEWYSLIIDKPLTIVGDPAPLIDGRCGSSPGDPAEAAILLDGPGSGTVVLENLQVISEYTTGSCGNADPLITGSGFDQLVVLSSELRGSDAIGDEFFEGAPAIDVQLSSVTVSQSIVVGGSSSTYVFDCAGANCLAANGQIGIRAPGGSVVLLDSQVSGGFAQSVNYVSFVGCPTSCDDITGGVGGAGVVASSVFLANSTVAGGAGGLHGCDTTSFTCQKPDGVPIAAAQVELLGNSLVSSGALPLGGTWDLTWFAPSAAPLLVLSPTVTAPALIGAKGWLFMDPDLILLVPVPGGGIQSASLSVPNDASLAGVALTAQVYDPVAGLTRPVTAPFLP